MTSGHRSSPFPFLLHQAAGEDGLSRADMMARLFPAGLGGPSPAVPGAAASPSPRGAAPFQPAPRLAERGTADGKSPGALRMSQGARFAAVRVRVRSRVLRRSAHVSGWALCCLDTHGFRALNVLCSACKLGTSCKVRVRVRVRGRVRVRVKVRVMFRVWGRQRVTRRCMRL